MSPDDRDPAVYRRLRARKARERARRERAAFDPSPPDDDDWTVPDRDGLRRVPTGPTPVEDVLASVLRDRNWGDRLRGVAVFDRWEEVVGPDVARHCVPVRLAGGILTVAAASPSWATQLRYLSSQLMVQVNSALGEPLVEEVVVTVQRPTGR